MVDFPTATDCKTAALAARKAKYEKDLKDTVNRIIVSISQASAAGSMSTMVKDIPAELKNDIAKAIPSEYSQGWPSPGVGETGLKVRISWEYATIAFGANCRAEECQSKTRS